MPNPLVGQGYDQFIATRQNPGQTQTEFYNKETNQAYANPNDLLRAVQPYAGNQMVDESNVFNVLAQGYTPRETALNQIKNDINSFQDQTFNSGAEAGQRASSSIAEQIGAETGNYDTYFKEYNDLKTQLKALSAPNYQQSYNDLRQSSGITGVENDFANNQKSIRELPYVNRQNFGNAGVATEGQLNADTQQKGIPLEIQQGNLLDRLKLAQSFIDNSLKFKELDSNAARQSLADGLQTALQTIELSRTHLGDLLEQQKSQQEIQDKAAQFAYENRIATPFFEIGGTIYRTSDRKPYATPEQFFADGGTKDFKNVQKVDVSKTFANEMATAEFNQQKIQNDRTYDLNARQLDSTKYQSVINPITGERMVFNPKTGEYSSISGSSPDGSLPNFGLAPKLYENGAKIADDFRQEQTVKDYNVTQNKYQSVQAILDSGVGGPGDLALVYEFMKALDPTSVVRETEYATAAKSGNIFAGILAKYNGYLKENGGFLPESVKQSFNSIIGTKFDVATKQYQNVYNEYSRRIDQVTGKPGVGSQFLTDYSKSLNTGTDPGSESNWNTVFGGDSSKTLDLNKAKKSGGLTFNTGTTASRGSSPAQATFASAYPIGTRGGQCGDFARKLLTSYGYTYPTLGDGKNSKTAAVQKYGVSINQWKPGTVLVTGENPTYGHVAVINSITSKGYQVTESNFNGKETVNHTRIIPFNSPKIIGGINPSLKTRKA